MDESREMAVAGQFYPKDTDELKAFIVSSFQSDFGPKKLPGKINFNRKIKAAIVPHAGYEYSGPCASCVYKAIAESVWPDTIIILGVDHKNAGKYASVWTDQKWKTPFGEIDIDNELAYKFPEPLFLRDKMPHIGEHSIEVQLPFLQYIFPDHKFKIVPIAISAPLSLETAEQMGKHISAVINSTKKNILLLASSDFIHYGLDYGFFPFDGEPKEARKKLAVLEYSAVNLVQDRDLAGFVEYTKANGLTICGAMPIAVLLAAVKDLGVKKSKLMKYYTSSELTRDFSSSVSYAGFIFE